MKPDTGLLQAARTARVSTWLLAFSLAAVAVGVWLISRTPLDGPREGPSKAVSVPAPLEQELASVAFNHPVVMYLGRRSQVTLAIATTEHKAVAAIAQAFDSAGAGGTKLDTVRIAPLMLAKLSGFDFNIEAMGPELKAFTENHELEWTWYVEPRRVGKFKQLRLEVFAAAGTMDARSSASTLVKRIEARVDVDVYLLDKILFHARELQPIAMVVTSFGVLGTVLAIYSKFVFFLRRRRARARARVLVRAEDTGKGKAVPPVA